MMMMIYDDDDDDDDQLSEPATEHSSHAVLLPVIGDVQQLQGGSAHLKKIFMMTVSTVVCDDQDHLSWFPN